MKAPKLFTRDEFRAAVFARDASRCVICGSTEKLDAHHIVERRLFPDGGYYLDNGAALCDDDGKGCHMKAEQTILSCEEIREAAGIKTVILPPHLYQDQRYDKWGNPILANGTRLRGELFDDPSAQRVLEDGGVLYLFSKYVKYPRTYHLPWSPGVTKDDRVMDPVTSKLVGAEVVVTEKMDGENTTLYNDYLHARSLEFTSHPSRNLIKSVWAMMCGDIPKDMRFCCENLYARHSIAYDNLPSYLMMYSAWDNTRNMCLGWDETVEWGHMLDLDMVPVLYRGWWDEPLIRKLCTDTVARGGEGIVVRVTKAFHYFNFRRCVAKYVRADHVQTHGGFMRQQVVPNKLRAHVESGKPK